MLLSSYGYIAFALVFCFDCVTSCSQSLRLRLNSIQRVGSAPVPFPSVRFLTVPLVVRLPSLRSEYSADFLQHYRSCRYIALVLVFDRYIALVLVSVSACVTLCSQFRSALRLNSIQRPSYLTVVPFLLLFALVSFTCLRGQMRNHPRICC